MTADPAAHAAAVPGARHIHQMNKFWALASVVWRVQLAYRMNLVLEALSSLLTALVTILFWTVVYREHPGKNLGGFSAPEIITYLIGAWAINNIALSSQADAVDSDIRLGNLSNGLLKPVHPVLVWLLQDLARKASFFLLAAAAYTVVAVVLRASLVAPASPAALGLCLAAVLCAVGLHFLLFSALGFLAFWMESTWGIRFAVRVSFEVASGAIIPLSFFPAPWRGLLDALPFRFLASFPMEVYLGKAGFWNGFLQEISWIVVLLAVCASLWRSGLRHYTAVGR